MKRRKENGKIYLNFPYNLGFSTKLKNYCGAKWNAETREWYFDEEFEDKSNDLMLEFFGSSYRSEETIKVEFRAWDFYNEIAGIVRINDVDLVWRKSRDIPVTMRSGVVIKSGEFSESGGSRLRPRVDIDEEDKDNIILIATLSKEFYDHLSDEQKGKMTVISEPSEKEKLLAQKERLLKELAEVEKRLNDMEAEA